MERIIILFLLIIFALGLNAQKINWQKSDLEKDSVFGVSSARAYAELLNNKNAKTIIVAIVDSGIDTSHENFKSILWTDTQNGGHGWNYIGAETGREDVTNLAHDKKEFYDSISFTLVPSAYRLSYELNRKMLTAHLNKVESMRALESKLAATKSIVDSILGKIGTGEPALIDFKNYQTQKEDERLVIRLIIDRWHLYENWHLLKTAELDNFVARVRYHVSHGLNLNNEEADTAKGNLDINPDVLGLIATPNLTSYHGTHVAGIIAGDKTNYGVSDHVKLMMLKVVGNIRELRDINLANAIRFAVDNGASIINLSFGKPYTWNKNAVDSAVQYAMKHDVLIIHAAGNDGQNLDKVNHFPDPVYGNKMGKAEAWIEVGASCPKNDYALVAPFSNYGKNAVDVFAPGVNIYSSIPGSKYEFESGTSMAAPVVSGAAALIREYYPQLTAIQVKDIIIRTVTKVDHLVKIKNKEGKEEIVPFSEVCSSGGIINLYKALLLAENYNIK
jgi:subtilisin family serine protease